MEIQETGLAIVLSRRDADQLYLELNVAFRSHGDWEMYQNRPNLVVLSKIYDDLYTRGFTGSNGTVEATPNSDLGVAPFPGVDDRRRDIVQ